MNPRTGIKRLDLPTTRIIHFQVDRAITPRSYANVLIHPAVRRGRSFYPTARSVPTLSHCWDFPSRLGRRDRILETAIEVLKKKIAKEQ